jgi:serine/threonine protein kinase
MQYIEGKTLKQYFESNQISELNIKDITSQLLKILSYIHKNGIVHRDIKPSNIMIDPNENVYLTDFGVIHSLSSEMTEITHTGNFIGTPAYSSPEQINGEKITHATDIYSLGIVLYELLNGKPPFSGSVISIINGHINLEPPEIKKKNRNSDFENIVRKMLCKNPNDRFQTTDEIIVLLSSNDYSNKPISDKSKEPIIPEKDTDKTVVDKTISDGPIKPTSKTQEGNSRQGIDVENTKIKSFFDRNPLPFLAICLLNLFFAILTFIGYFANWSGIGKINLISTAITIYFYSLLLSKNKKVYSYINHFFILFISFDFIEIFVIKGNDTPLPVILIDFVIILLFYLYLKNSKKVKEIFQE